MNKHDLRASAFASLPPRRLYVGDVVRVPVPYWTWREITKIERPGQGDGYGYRYWVTGRKEPFYCRARGGRMDVRTPRPRGRNS